MGKRSDFERRPQDFYATPKAAVLPLLPFLSPKTAFVEPCAGDGTLIRHLEAAAHTCTLAMDIEPRSEGIKQMDALVYGTGIFGQPCFGPHLEIFITNPPWSRSILHALIEHLTPIAPAWLLIDSDWAFTKQAAPLLPRLRKIVVVGRVKWIEDSAFTGKDNCAWFLFDMPNGEPPTFHGHPMTAAPSEFRLEL